MMTDEQLKKTFKVSLFFLSSLICLCSDAEKGSQEKKVLLLIYL
jgi:hypothetical protein